MAEFQWWLLLVGLVAGGGLVAVVSMNGRRREEDLEELERRAEANWIVERMADSAQWVDRATVDSILRLHRDYLAMPPPDAILVEREGPPGGDDALDLDDLDRDPVDPDRLGPDPDRVPDEVRHDGRRRADQDLAPAGEEQTPAS